MANYSTSQEVIIEYGPDGTILNTTMTAPRGTGNNLSQSDRQSRTGTRINVTDDPIIDITVDELYQRNITDEQFQTEMSTISQTYITPFDDTPSSESSGLPAPEALRLPSPILNVDSILENFEEATMWEQGFRELAMLSLKEDWFRNEYAHYLEDTLQLTKIYYYQLADCIKTNRHPTFWERHVGNGNSIHITELVNNLFADYKAELEVAKISRSWLKKCIQVIFDIPDEITYKHYLKIVIHDTIDSYDSFYIHVKESIALALISAEMIRKGDLDLKVELLGLLDLLPHSACILKELSLHSRPEIRIAVVKSLSAINFHQKHTFQSLLRASFDNDCRVRLEFCKYIPEFVINIDSELLETDDYETAINVQIAVMKNHICKKDIFPCGELIERVTDIWKNDTFDHISEEAYSSLKRIGIASIP